MEVLIEDLETLHTARQDLLKAGTDTKGLDNMISRSMTSLKDSQAKQLWTKISLSTLERVIKLSIAFASDSLGAAQLQDIILLAVQDHAFQHGSERLHHACVRLTRLRSHMGERKDTINIVGDLSAAIVDLVHEMIHRDEKEPLREIPISQIPAHHWHIPIQRATSGSEYVVKGYGLTIVLYFPDNFLIVCKNGEDLSKKDARWKMKPSVTYQDAKNYLSFTSWFSVGAQISVGITIHSEETKRHLLDKIRSIDPSRLVKR